MLELLWSVICKDHSINPETKRPIPKDVFDGIDFDIPQNAVQGFEHPLEFGGSVVCTWNVNGVKNNEHVTITTEFVAPLGFVVLRSEQRIAINPSIKTFNTVTRLDALPVNGSGDYAFVIKVTENDGVAKVVGQLPLNVVVQAVLPPQKNLDKAKPRGRSPLH